MSERSRREKSPDCKLQCAAIKRIPIPPLSPLPKTNHKKIKHSAILCLLGMIRLVFRVMNTVTHLILLNHTDQGVHVDSASGLLEWLYHSATYRQTSVHRGFAVRLQTNQLESGWLLAGVRVISGCSSVL